MRTSIPTATRLDLSNCKVTSALYCSEVIEVLYCSDITDQLPIINLSGYNYVCSNIYNRFFAKFVHMCKTIYLNVLTVSPCYLHSKFVALCYTLSRISIQDWRSELYGQPLW